MEFEHHAPHDTTPSPPPPSLSKCGGKRKEGATRQTVDSGVKV
jgi:hypothetical protein